MSDIDAADVNSTNQNLDTEDKNVNTRLKKCLKRYIQKLDG